MKKSFLLAAMSAALCLGAVACGDDDDDNGNGGNGGNGGNTSGSVVASAALSDFDGVRLTKIDDCSFDYDSDGVLSRVSHDGDLILFDYKKGTFTMRGDDYDQLHHFTTDNMGRITGFTYTAKDDDESGNVSYTFRYDEAGHLVYMEYKSSSTDDGKSYEEKETVTYTWEGDLLTKCVSNEEETIGGVTERDVETFVYSYTDAPDNRFMQYTYELSANMEIDDDVTPPMCAGLYGKGPAKYPTGIVISDTHGNESRYTIRYTLNSKGLVETEDSSYTSSYNDYTDRNTYRYTYK